MEQITIVVNDSVGVLADVSYLLGKAKINIESLTAASLSGKAIIVFFVKDGGKARKVLESNGYKALESEILVLRLKDAPGQLSQMTMLLKKENVNILNLYFIAKEKGSSIIALRVDKTAKAKKLLKSYMEIED